MVQVSIEGGEETHNYIRGNGNLNKVIEGIHCLVKHGIYTMISFTATAGNYKEFANVAQLGVDLNVGAVWSDRLIGAGNDMPHMDIEQTEEYMQVINDARTKHRGATTDIKTHRSLQFLVSGGRPYSCSIGKSIIAVMPNGDVMPCRRMDKVIGVFSWW